MESLKALVARKVHDKKGYYLGKNSDGFTYLEKPSFDCGWYWGFGYIEVYETEYKREQHIHSHWDSYIIGKHEYFDTENAVWRLSSEYIHHLNENPDFTETVLTDTMSWTLAELFATAYQLRKQAELLHMGGSHITSNPLHDILKDTTQYKHINGVLLPQVFNEIDKILNPNHEDLTEYYKEQFNTKYKGGK